MFIERTVLQSKTKSKIIPNNMSSISNSTTSTNINMSSMLSNNLKGHYNAGKTLIDDSKDSDKSLLSVITDVIQPYAQSLFDKLDIGLTVIHEKRISSFDCYQVFQQWINKTEHDFHTIPDELIQSYKKSCMSPDGGILFVVTKKGKKYPLLITEDKIQGTNDVLFKNGKKKQPTGNAIERAAKNMNLSKTLSGNLSYFPYVLFASGCDFYHTESISMRLVQMNYLIPNHYIDIHNAEKNIDTQLQHILQNIDISKKYGSMDVATICIKSHQWNKGLHGSSNWEAHERIQICKKVIDQAYFHITKMIFKVEE